MGGVAKELDLAARASQGRRGGLADDDLPQYERWRRICADSDTTVEIDIVAGTSAGGLNGTILATSYGLGTTLPDLKQMWQESGSISRGKLLPPKKASSSVLDGGFFQKTVGEVLCGIRDSSDSGAPSSPVTLFVTSTALGDHRRAYADSFSQGFLSPDHRRVYRFRSQPPSGEGNEFETSFGALAPAARASAGFPVAFAPIEEPTALLDRAIGPQDFTDRLMDGGVLDNAPFGPVLDEIVARPVDGDVQRIVVYVVPSDGGGGVLPAASAIGTDEPSWFTVLRSALTFPGEADFRDDLDDLTRIFSTADAQRGAALSALRAAVDPAVSKDVIAALRAGSSFLRAQYRLQQPHYDVAAFVDRIQGRTENVIRLEPLLSNPTPGASVEPPVSAEDLAMYGHSAAERMVRNLLADLRGRLHERGTTAALSAGAREVSRALGGLVEERERIEDGVVDEAKDPRPGGPVIGEMVSRALEQGSRTRRTELSRAIDAYASAVGTTVEVVTEAVVAVEIVSQALAPQVRSAPPPFQLLRLGPDNDSPLAPSAAGFGDKKLYGTRLGHFGAFGHAEWRAWDWGWGRLDAAAQLGRALGLDSTDILELQQGIWDVEGAGQDLDVETKAVGNRTEIDLRHEIDSNTVNGLLDSTARMLRAAHTDQPKPIAFVAPKVGTMLRTRLTLNPLWLVPGVIVRRKLRGFFLGPRRSD
ncbi:DUF3376 domain-containing protein [Actinomycetospora endophytica]|uniref:DUF3376 domain-containing protein n=2 Tax=Actinomycetospora endophytica TaxID=2291215 RepID=A0ABS8PD15_9PSEU|nr:DUF3376 domain-containing protein [Actinomycetospora endophytica]